MVPSTYRHILAIVDTAAVLGRNAHTLGEQEVVIALTAFKALGDAASEARESSTGALAGVCADGVVAVGGTLESCGEKRQGECGRQSPTLSYKDPIQVYRQLQLPYCTGREEVEGIGEMRNAKTECQAGETERLG